MRVFLLTVFCLLALSALCYKAVIDTYDEVQVEVYDAVMNRLARHSVTDITVQVDVRDVTLSGIVPDADYGDSIHKLVESISVVRNVESHIEVQATQQAPQKPGETPNKEAG